MFILKKGHQPGVYVPLRALFLVGLMKVCEYSRESSFLDFGPRSFTYEN